VKEVFNLEFGLEDIGFFGNEAVAEETLCREVFGKDQSREASR